MPDVKDVINGLEEVIAEAVYPDRPRKFMMPLELAEDALALLKAQEPRVMSEVELREIQNEIPVWIEVPFEGCDIGHWVLVGYHHYEYKGFKYSFDDGALDGMGVKWRCWTSRPDQATREATPWLT
jgi:hypothetical protein